jgi:hypothetical protein
MNDSTSEQRPVVSSLTPTDSALKHFWSQDNATEFPFNEYRLNGKPESLKAFVEQFLLGNGRTYNKNLLVWTSKHSFVTNTTNFLPGSYRYRNHGIKLWLESGSAHSAHSIHSSTREDAMSCLDLLVGLHDDHYEKIGLVSREDGPPILPLTWSHGLHSRSESHASKQRN